MRNKNDLSVSEAAKELGVTPEELRSVLVRHVIDDPEAVRNIPRMRFRPADLIMLRAVVESSRGARQGVEP